MISAPRDLIIYVVHDMKNTSLPPKNRLRGRIVQYIPSLNALIRDQLVKMSEVGLNVSVLRGDRVDTEDASNDDCKISLDVPVEVLSR